MISAMSTITWQRDKLQRALLKELFLQKTDMSYMCVCNIQISSVVMILPIPGAQFPILSHAHLEISVYCTCQTKISFLDAHDIYTYHFIALDSRILYMLDAKVM